jgi:hypothetical protein
MPLPEIIPVKYTEEEAEYVSIRPLVQQQFRCAELVDMIVRVTGKDAARVQQILRTGTIVFHAYRYWWPAVDPDEVQIREWLANYPDPDASRPFRAENCTEVILESGGPSAPHAVDFERAQASRKRFLRSRSFWDCLLDVARETQPAYREYSYARCGDVYSVPLTPEQVRRLTICASRYATRAMAAKAGAFASASQIAFLCAR